jgi:hypothetical protein
MVIEDDVVDEEHIQRNILASLAAYLADLTLELEHHGFAGVIRT